MLPRPKTRNSIVEVRTLVLSTKDSKCCSNLELSDNQFKCLNVL